LSKWHYIVLKTIFYAKPFCPDIRNGYIKRISMIFQYKTRDYNQHTHFFSMHPLVFCAVVEAYTGSKS